MRVDICSREDYTTQAALFEAFAQVGAYPEDDFEMEVPLPTGFMRFRVGTEILTVFSDAWNVDLEGSDEVVKRVLAAMA
ncbi:MAG: hypothetical protein C0467_20550 [Planctomycetaceae bacterium]|nr:hypothetical protein [Planctomycetaceae bacterium]